MQYYVKGRRFSLSYYNKRLAEYKEFLRHKSASVIGVGISNIPLIGFLLDNGVRVTARDMKSFEELCGINGEVENLAKKRSQVCYRRRIS